MTFNDLISVCTQIRALGLCVVLSLSACSGFEKVLRTDIELGMAVDELKSELEDFKLTDECEKIFQPLHTPPQLNEGGFLTYSGISFVEDYKFKPMTYILLRNGVVVKVVIVGESSSSDINHLYKRAYQDLTGDLGNEKYSFGEDGSQSIGYRDSVADSSDLMALGLMFDKKRWICYRYKVWNGANETEYSEYNNIQVVLASLNSVITLDGADYLRNNKRYLLLSYEYFPDKLDYEALSTGERKYTSYVNGKITKVKCIYPNFAVAYTEEYTDGKVNGEVFRNFEDGSRQAVTLYVSGNKHGKETQWRKDGSLLQVDSYERGVHVDSTIVYYEDESIKEITLYKDGEPASSRGYYKSGSIKQIEHYVNEKNADTTKIFYENGQKMKLVPHTNGEIEGIVSEYYEHGGPKKVIPFKNGLREGLAVEYFPSGQIRTERFYAGDQLNGLSRWWYENGKKKTEWTYIDGVENGISISWYESGQKMWEGKVEMGLKQGIIMEWHENGKVKHKNMYLNDKKDGLSREYYEDGKMAVEAEWKDGKLEGAFRLWYENGNLHQEGQYANNNREGFWKGYEESGALSVEAVFRNGERVSSVDVKMKKWIFSSITEAETWLNNSVWVWKNNGAGTWSEKHMVAFTRGRYEFVKMQGGRKLREYTMNYRIKTVNQNRIIVHIQDIYGNGGDQVFERIANNQYILNGLTYTRK